MSRQKSSYIEEFSKRLRFIVDERYFGVWAHLGKAAMIPSGTFARYMKGEGLPRLEQFARIVEAANAEPRWLLTGEGTVFQDEMKLRGETGSPEGQKSVYLEAGRIIAALQQRIEQLESELVRVRSALTNPTEEN